MCIYNINVICSVFFFCTFQLSDRNDTSTRYKAIIQFWRVFIVSPGKIIRATLITNVCKPSNLHSFLLTKFQMLFSNPVLLYTKPKHRKGVRIWHFCLDTDIQDLWAMIPDFTNSLSYLIHCISCIVLWLNI